MTKKRNLLWLAAWVLTLIALPALPVLADDDDDGQAENGK